ncbi:MAG: FeoA family protein [Bacteroidota bacterium]
MVAQRTLGQTVSSLKKGGSGIISTFDDEHVAKKMMSMGVLPGAFVKYIRKAPFGGGCYIQVDNLLIALRNQEAEGIVLR